MSIGLKEKLLSNLKQNMTHLYFENSSSTIVPRNYQLLKRCNPHPLLGKASL